MKLERIIKNLFDPSNTLSCSAMRSFIEKCNSQSPNCDIDGIEMTKDQSIDFAINQGLIPEEVSESFKKEISSESMCRYINDLKVGTTEQMDIAI